jgi:thiol-disulfide isomerase/thioredoxin
MKVIRWKAMTLLIALMVAGICGLAIVRHIEVEAQDTQSIVGSSPLHSLSEADGWINSKPLSAKELKGKVVLVDFWDYSCINCIRAIPYIRAWADKVQEQRSCSDRSPHPRIRCREANAERRNGREEIRHHLSCRSRQ